MAQLAEPEVNGNSVPVQSDTKANVQCASDEPGLPFSGIIIDAPHTFLGTTGVPTYVTGGQVKDLVEGKLGLTTEDQRLTDKYSVLAREAQILDPVADPLGVRPMLRVEATDPLSVFLKRRNLEDVHDRDMAGRTALHHAAYEGNLGQVVIALDAGAEVDALDINLFSPLHLAALRGHEGVAYRLLKSNADPRRTNYQGQSAGDLEKLGGHTAAYFGGHNPRYPSEKKDCGSLARTLAERFKAEMEAACKPFQYPPPSSRTNEEKGEGNRAGNEVLTPEASSKPEEKLEVTSTDKKTPVQTQKKSLNTSDENFDFGLYEKKAKRKRVSKKAKVSDEDRRETPFCLVGWPDAWNRISDHSNFTKEEGRQSYMTFRQFLHEGDGEIDKDVLPVVIKTLGYQLCDKQAIQDISDEITHYGTLDFEEFLKFMKMYSAFEHTKWQQHFDKFDEDKSGEVSIDELKLVLMELGYTPLPEMLDEALKEVDDDGSGSINLHEFMNLIEQYRETEGFTRDELDSLEDLFERFDRDEDEQLNSTDIYHLKRYMGLKGSKLEEDADMRPLGWKGYLAEMRRYYEAEITFFRKEFEAHDVDKSGHVSRAELMDVLQNLGFTPLKNMIDEVIAIVDKDGSNELDFFEFNRMMWYYRKSEGFTHAEIAELAEAFGRHDKDKSGEISIMELGDILRYLGRTPNLTQLKTLVEEFDVDGSGDVGLTEFLKIMRRFREEEVREFKFVFKKYDKDGSGSLATQEVAKVLRFLGREVSMPIVEAAIAEVDLDGSGELDWDEFVVLMDKYRKMEVSDKRHRCGFHDAQIFHYKTKFQAVDKDGSDDLNPTEINKLLTDLNMAPRTPEQQSHVAQLLEECRNLAEEQDGKTTFWVFLRLMRFLEDEKDKKALADEQNAIEESKFSKQEVNEFREIFFHQASTDAKSGLPGASNSDKALSPEGVLRMLMLLGKKPTADEKEQLFKMVKEADQDGNGHVDFPDFLILMRRLVDANFCGLNQAAEEAAT